MKNISAIEKIIKELSFRDYRSANPIGKDGMLKRKFRPYSLSIETNEAREIRNKYLHDEITEDFLLISTRETKIRILHQKKVIFIKRIWTQKIILKI